MLRWLRRHDRTQIRLFAGFFGVLLVGQGIAVLWLGQQPGGRNYWGGLVFPPLAIVIGLVLLVGAFRGRSPFLRVPLDKEGKPIRFPHQEIRKW